MGETRERCEAERKTQKLAKGKEKRMPELQLSRRGRIVSYVAMAVLCLIAIVTLIAKIPPASWVNGFQAILTNGSYSPKLTIILLVVPSLGLGWLCGILFDAVTQRGEFRDTDTRRRRRRQRDEFEEWEDF